MSKPNTLFTVNRTTHFNGTCLEAKQPYGFFHTREEAEVKAEALTNLTFKNIALKGLTFNFYVSEESFG